MLGPIQETRSGDGDSDNMDLFVDEDGSGESDELGMGGALAGRRARDTHGSGAAPDNLLGSLSKSPRFS